MEELNFEDFLIFDDPIFEDSQFEGLNLTFEDPIVYDPLICHESVDGDTCYCGAVCVVKETDEGTFLTCNYEENKRIYGFNCSFFVPLNSISCLSCDKKMYFNICMNSCCEKMPMPDLYIKNHYTFYWFE